MDDPQIDANPVERCRQGSEAIERPVTVFEVRVEPDDLGQLIGRQGRTARALRALLDVRGSRDGRRYGLDIREY